MVKVKDLKDQIAIPYPRSLLYCGVCGTENSANAGDYFAANPEHVFICCGIEMTLVIKKTTYEEI